MCAVTRGGAFAEEVVVPEGAVLKLPHGVDLITAAGLLLRKHLLLMLTAVPFPIACAGVMMQRIGGTRTDRQFYVVSAGLPVAFGTSHVALKERANVQPGQTVLVLGAAGGVGIAAVQAWACTTILCKNTTCVNSHLLPAHTASRTDGGAGSSWVKRR